jgi:triacylglycerol lipase
MIAWLMRLLLLMQVLVAAGLFLALNQLLHLSVPAALLLSVGFIVLIRLLVIGNNFLLARRYRSPLPDGFHLGWRQAAGLYLREAKATLTASSCTMPFGRFSERVAKQPAGLPVLLVHGYGCNSGYWRAMSRALLGAQITHHAIDMEPVFGGIDDYVPHLHRAIEQLCKDTGSQRIVIVGHSMGGLVARAYLRDHGSARIARVVTLGTPHHGTMLALYGIGINTQQMQWSSENQEGLCSKWLRDLAAMEGPEVYRLFVSIFSHHDNIISPQTSARLPGAKNIELVGIGHVALVPDPVVQAHVIGEVRAAPNDCAPASWRANG